LAAAAASDDDDPTTTAVIPLPYAHYRLVTSEGWQLERPDKHPFALSRVLYDARCVCVCVVTSSILCIGVW
jgi:hypothetical protein